MTVRYRDWWGNIGMAVAVVLVAGVFGVAMWTGSGEGGPVIGWITAPGAVILVAILVVRCLRRGVDVDDDGVTKRDPWATTFVPWCAVRDLEFRNEYDATFVLDDRRRVFVSAPITRGAPSLREAYDDVRRRWSADMGRGNTYPRPGRRFVTLGFWIAALALVLGAGVWDDARFHADAYAARDRRERQGTAVVTHVSVGEHDGGEGDPSYKTHVEARLQIPEGRTVLIDLKRNGDYSDVYDEEDPVAVVYDRAHPRDADFADRPNRESDDDSVEVREVVGPIMLWAGLAGVVAFGIVIVVDWNRRHPRGGAGSILGH